MSEEPLAKGLGRYSSNSPRSHREKEHVIFIILIGVIMSALTTYLGQGRRSTRG